MLFRIPFDTIWGSPRISSTLVLFLFVTGILIVLLHRTRPIKAATQAYHAPAKPRALAIVLMTAALYLGFCCFLVKIRASYEELLLAAWGLLYTSSVIFVASFFLKVAPQTGAQINDR
jgi:hypothetical protein